MVKQLTYRVRKKKTVSKKASELSPDEHHIEHLKSQKKTTMTLLRNLINTIPVSSASSILFAMYLFSFLHRLHILATVFRFDIVLLPMFLEDLVVWQSHIHY